MKIYLYNTSGITGNKKAALTPWLKRGACGQVGLLVIQVPGVNSVRRNKKEKKKKNKENI